MLVGIDVSHHQVPRKFLWSQMSGQLGFLVARASYGKGTKDRAFADFATYARENGLVFGAYHFYRQIHSVEEQLALFEQQLMLAGGLREGDLYPVLDMEENHVNGDGTPKPEIFSSACLRFAEAMIDKYGGVILYYSSYFPEYLKSHKDWIKTLPNTYHWLADYRGSAGLTPPGQPRTPYSPTWHLHQYMPKPTPLYPVVVNGKQAPVDHNVLNPVFALAALCIGGERPALSADARSGERDTDERPGGAFWNDYGDAMELLREGAEKTLEGIKILAEQDKG